jgi:hypothetical protein
MADYARRFCDWTLSNIKATKGELIRLPELGNAFAFSAGGGIRSLLTKGSYRTLASRHFQNWFSSTGLTP